MRKRACTTVVVGIAALVLGACGAQSSTTEQPPAESAQVEAQSPTVPEQEPAEEASPTAVAVPALPAPSPEEANAFALSTQHVGLELLRRAPGSNDVVLSPLSISTAVAMTYVGAGGETADEIRDAMHFGDDADALHRAAGHQLARLTQPGGGAQAPVLVANRLFIEDAYPVVPAFLQRMQHDYAAPPQSLSFSDAPEPSRLAINRFVSEATQERIDEILPDGSIDALTRLVLVNAVYFLGRWQVEFDPSRTRPAPFWTPGGMRTARMMRGRMLTRYVHGEGHDAIELNYEGVPLSLLVILPQENDGLTALLEQLDPAGLDAIVASMHETTVDVALPRFQISPAEPMRLKAQLSTMGIRRLFTASADLSAMATPPESDDGLFVADVFHRAFIAVDEEGTEAAAATAVVIQTRGAAPQDHPRFVADHPFAFFVRDRETGALLIVGRYAGGSA